MCNHSIPAFAKILHQLLALVKLTIALPPISPANTTPHARPTQRQHPIRATARLDSLALTAILLLINVQLSLAALPMVGLPLRQSFDCN